MHKDYIDGGDLPARRGIDLRQAKWLDGGVMGHDRDGSALVREEPFQQGSREMKKISQLAGPSTFIGGRLQVMPNVYLGVSP